MSEVAGSSRGTTPNPTLSDGRTSLRRFTAADAQVYAAINRDALNVKWAGSDATMTEQDAAGLIEGDIADGWSTGSSLRFAVAAAGSGTPEERIVGTVSLQSVFRPAEGGGSASVGIKLAEAGRGHGHAAGAVALLCGYAFGTLGLEILHWRTTAGNEPSRKLALGSGFVLAAEIPGFGHVDGKVADGWMFTQTAKQWQDHVDGKRAEVSAPEDAIEVAVVVPRLSDGSVVLRELQEADAEQLVLNCVNLDAVRWTTVPLGYTREHADYFINTITADGWRSRETLTFAVADAVTDHLLGTVDLQCKTPGAASIGINFGPDARGTGAAEKAVRLLAEYAFNELNLSYLHWHALVPNWGSRKLAWKLGFRFEGEIRGDYNDRGTPSDRWILSLAAGDERAPLAPWDGPAPLTR
ncbi:GNAT family N-acetyltransferase [Arthrobacter sp. GMC3]|uniref:GNAT family N-acetyltransferase n=1 Tax=Arthrobacter sp. GMC3 TaxID=2058894 RepID=UPI0015E2C9AE|nr:GNAT family protein [Arthrobacter sp. GMC3]